MSKMTVRLHRVVEFATESLVTPGKDQTVQQAIQAALARNGPTPPGFRVFAVSGAVSVAAMEAAAFVITDAHRPQAGLVQTDPIIIEQVNQLDGALRSELMRQGVYTDCEAYQWRMGYELEGN